MAHDGDRAVCPRIGGDVRLEDAIEIDVIAGGIRRGTPQVKLEGSLSGVTVPVGLLGVVGAPGVTDSNESPWTQPVVPLLNCT